MEFERIIISQGVKNVTIQNTVHGHRESQNIRKSVEIIKSPDLMFEILVQIVFLRFIKCCSLGAKVLLLLELDFAYLRIMADGFKGVHEVLGDPIWRTRWRT